ncbi:MULTISPECIES: RapZ C-terminal domain-containing protein [Streptomyces]|uniref:RNase adapter RapZ n=1 Tax=Streptomyces griseiscabiei TaxID=2993540 RepID=A0ABU4LKP3_9ACTN|nr:MULTISPECIES: RNase adapter RapZ [Streptomyces]MDX2915699.1 RNase adapter RapZ [Streptomyces griseiscabiei]
MTSDLMGSQSPHALIQTVIISYGEGHHDAPRGDALRVDARPLRNPPEDPTMRDRMLHSTGLDPEVRAYVLSSPGAERLIDRSTRRALALLGQARAGRRVDLHVVCGGGRHRSVAVAEEVAERLRAAGYGVETDHPHIARPILRWHPQLTEHELTALRLLASGQHHLEVAKELKVQPETAGRLLHRAQIHLRARTLYEAVAQGCALGIIDPEPPGYPHRRSAPPAP